MSGNKHLVFEIELPCMYTDDLDEVRGLDGIDESESDFLLNCCGDPSVVRVRMEIAGDKDSSIVEVWGYIREAKLVDPSRGYEAKEPHLTDDQLAEQGSHNLMRDDRSACDWCRYAEPVVSPRPNQHQETP